MNMKRWQSPILVLVILFLFPLGLASAQGPVGLDFTYQGYLTGDDVPIDGTCDLRFTLWNDPLAGSQVGPLVERPAVPVGQGRFTTRLDFGNVYDGTALWLQVAVRCGDPDYTTLAPRQALTATPYAAATLSLRGQPLSGAAPAAGQALKWDGTSWIAAPDDDTTYSAGAGLVLVGTVFAADETYLQRRVAPCGEGYAIRQVNQDGSVVCALVDNTTYDAGFGLILSGTTFLADPTVLQQRITAACGEGAAIRQVNQDGSVVCELDDDTTYTAGTGLDLVGTEFSILPPYRLPQACASGELPKWDGTAWACAADVGVTDHGALSGLGDDDHGQYVHVATPRTITARHTFNPTAADSPFILGANAAGQLVTGLNADLLDGYHAGNAAGNVPLSNGVRNVNLNADMLDGLHAEDFAAFDHDHWGETWTGSGTGLTLTSTNGIGLRGSGSMYGLWGTSGTTTGYGVYGNNTAGGYGVYGASAGTATRAAGGTYGLHGSGSATAVYGQGGAYGVYGSGTSAGVYGASAGTAVRAAGGTHGLHGSGSSTAVYGQGGAYGVYGTGSTYGVWGSSGAPGGYGVYGNNTAGGYGVYGASAGTAVRAAGGTHGLHGSGSATAVRAEGGDYGLYATGAISGVAAFGDNQGLYAAGGSMGVYGTSAGTGVYAWGDQYGLMARSYNGTAIYAQTSLPGTTAIRADGATTGVHGTGSDAGVYGSGMQYGVYGYGSATAGVYGVGRQHGVYGRTTFVNQHGVYGWAANTTGDGIGVYGRTSAPSGNWAGWFEGNVRVTGVVVPSGGATKIDDPRDPANAYLYHAFVESPDMKNLLDGVVTLGADGTAWVELPDWFEALNQDFRYQLTPIGGAAPGLYIAREVAGDRFQIAGGPAGLKVSWLLTGIRADPWAEAHRVQVEVAKPAAERGTYLHPELYGQPPELRLGYRPAPAPPLEPDEPGPWPVEQP